MSSPKRLGWGRAGKRRVRPSSLSSPVTALSLFLKIVFILEREGREKGEKRQRVVASRTPPTGDLAHNPGMCPENGTGDPLVCRPALSPLSHTSQGSCHGSVSCLRSSSLIQTRKLGSGQVGWLPTGRDLSAGLLVSEVLRCGSQAFLLCGTQGSCRPTPCVSATMASRWTTATATP